MLTTMKAGTIMSIIETKDRFRFTAMYIHGSSGVYAAIGRNHSMPDSLLAMPHT